MASFWDFFKIVSYISENCYQNLEFWGEFYIKEVGNPAKAFDSVSLNMILVTLKVFKFP